MARRRKDRFGVTNIAGVLRVLSEVTVRRGLGGEFVAISDAPATIGEQLTLDRIVNGTLVTVPVCVIDSRPAMLRGTLCHWLRLRQSDEGAQDTREIRRAGRAKSRDR